MSPMTLQHQGWHVGLPMLLPSTVGIPTLMTAMSADLEDRNTAQPVNEEQE